MIWMSCHVGRDVGKGIRDVDIGCAIREVG